MVNNWLTVAGGEYKADVDPVWTGLIGLGLSRSWRGCSAAGERTHGDPIFKAMYCRCKSCSIYVNISEFELNLLLQ